MADPKDDKDDDDITDPKENPISGGHLPGPGEIGGPISYNHDPATYDTTDDSVV